MIHSQPGPILTASICYLAVSQKPDEQDSDQHGACHAGDYMKTSNSVC